MTREEEIYNQSVDLFSAVDKQPKNFEGVSSKRQLNITKEAEERYLSSPLHQYYSAEDLVKSFRDGAEWADKHPVNIWHDASEEPQGEYEIIYQDEFNHVWLATYRKDIEQYKNWWEECVACNYIVHWAYIRDLLPKGSTKRIER